ncbi:MAG: hypothetical protein H6672_08170 [Anaerolineaceae bacterium]|nr:hypothetical protein [Anaerolineaceae bacterium]
MSGIIWLITEDESDFKVVQALLAAYGYRVTVKWKRLTGGSGGISRLVDQVDRLIQTALVEKGKNDCIAVLHDADIHKESERSKYEAIKKICTKRKVKHIVAYDELESWLLADAGVSRWLGIKHENWDSRRKPKDDLNRLMKDKIGHKYQGAYKKCVLDELKKDTANNKSPSLKKALQHLDNAPCTR